MDKYLKENIFETLKDSLIYIERGQSDGKIRHGLIGMVDLDQYATRPSSCPTSCCSSTIPIRLSSSL